MTPEAQRIAIAEACGWKFWHRPGDETLLLRPDERWPTEPYWKENGFVAGDGRPDCPIVDLTGLPDYLNDLNAMHEAEKVLDERQQDVFAAALGYLTGGRQIDLGALRINTTTKILFATAAQRAEAFLRTLGVWKE